MAQTSLVAAVLLLALIANHIDCAMNMLIESDYCKKATYQETNLDEFTKACAPKGWEEFFQDPQVLKVIAESDVLTQDPVKEIIALKSKGNKYVGYHIEPPMQLMFEAFERVSPEDLKVVILGQDPTPQEGKATGRAFSVENPLTVGSVLNVLLEVALEGWSVNLFNGDLSKWENQGVLLLNSALTIGEIQYIGAKDNKPKREQVSHLGYWCPFTKLLIEYISKKLGPSVWMLWGKVAQDFTVKRAFNAFSECFNYDKASKTDITQKPSLISKPKNYILMGGHPSPLGGAGGMNTFFARNYFHCANEFLKVTRGVEIDWGLVDGDRCAVKSVFYQCPKV